MKHLIIASFAAALLTATAAPAFAANDRDLSDAMAKSAGISKAQAQRALTALITAITADLTKGNKVKIKDFGVFSVSKRAARTGKNPQTGATIKIAASKVAKFKAAKKLANAIK